MAPPPAVLMRSPGAVCSGEDGGSGAAGRGRRNAAGGNATVLFSVHDRLRGSVRQAHPQEGRPAVQGLVRQPAGPRNDTTESAAGRKRFQAA